jgi:TrmH family RNA methyltransferase
MGRVITSAANPRLKLVRKLASRRQRDKLGLFVCEGEDLVTAGLDTGLEPVEALVDADRPVLGERLARAELVSSELMAELSTLAHPARVIALFRRADLPRGLDAPVGLGLWHVGDPGNVGTLLRAADAFGAGIALSEGCADPTGPKAIRASMGSLFRVPVGRFDEPRGTRVALVPKDGIPLTELDSGGELVLLLGSEREGLPPEVLEHCDERASIPQSGGAESLNVAMAGAIALYELARRKQA